ncbi:MAG: hypothetical protein AAGI92_07095 [Pseudomonadota bacterium]
MRAFGFAFVSVAVAAIGFAATAFFTPKVHLIVDRQGDDIELFLNAQAPDLQPVFSLDPAEFKGVEGAVNFASFRETGTWLMADEVLNSVSARTNESNVLFEGTSLMLHQASVPVSFSTPVDGVMSVSVCAVPITEPVSDLTDYETYAGFYARNVEIAEDIELAFPKTGRLPRLVTVRQFVDGEPQGWNIRLLMDGGTLTI